MPVYIGDMKDVNSARVLNTHAKLQTVSDMVISDQTRNAWKAAFNEFVSLLETSGTILPDGFEDSNFTCPLTAAYWRLHQAQDRANKERKENYLRSLPTVDQ